MVADAQRLAVQRLNVQRSDVQRSDSHDHWMLPAVSGAPRYRERDSPGSGLAPSQLQGYLDQSRRSGQDGARDPRGWRRRKRLGPVSSRTLCTAPYFESDSPGNEKLTGRRTHRSAGSSGVTRTSDKSTGEDSRCVQPELPLATLLTTGRIGRPPLRRPRRPRHLRVPSSNSPAGDWPSSDWQGSAGTPLPARHVPLAAVLTAACRLRGARLSRRGSRPGFAGPNFPSLPVHANPVHANPVLANQDAAS